MKKILRNLIEVKEQKENLLPKIREQAADQIATNQLKSKKTNIDEKHKNALSRVNELNQRISELENDYIRENELILDAESVLKKSTNEKNSILNTQSDLTNKIKSTKEDLDLSIIDFNKIEKEYEVEANNFAASLAKNNLETNFEVNNKSLKQVEEKITKVKDDKSKVSLRKEEIDNELINIRNELELSEKAIDKKSSMLDKTEDEVQTLRADLLNFEEKLSEERSKLLAIKSEIKTLEEFLSEQEIFEDAIINQIEISKDFEIVFSVILNDDLNYPPQSSDRKSGWHYSENEKQSYSFPKGVKVLADLVKHPLELNKRLKKCWYRKFKRWLFTSLEVKNGQSLVSMDGDFWRWDGFSTTSADVNTSNTQKVKNLNRLQNLKVLQKEIEKKYLSSLIIKRIKNWFLNKKLRNEII